MPQAEERKLAAIMFADIVGYSRMMSLDEDRTISIKDDFEKISLPITTSFKGKIIKKVGDEIFCEFSSAKNAVDAALEIQKSLSKYNESQSKDFKLLARIGVHIGDIVVGDDNDIHGDGVNVTSRITPFANPGGVYNMAGNVWEWIEDWYDSDYYNNTDNFTDPVNTVETELKVRRGGSWNYHQATLKSAARAEDEQFKGNDHFGFRITRDN